MESSIKRIGKTALSVILLAAIVFAAIVEFLTLTEFRPEKSETIAVGPVSGDAIQQGDTLRIMTWNCGYGALGDNADFFMDGGNGVYTADRERIERNLGEISAQIARLDPDIVLLQEVDRDSSRSRHIDEVISIYNDLWDVYELDYTIAFAYNLIVQFLPYPIPPIGKVQSGILTLAVPGASSAERVQLPCSFKWPVRLANFKRCLLIERFPIKNSDKELVLINLHLDAYDDGEGKKAQTDALMEVLNDAAVREEIGDGNYVIAGGDFNQSFDGEGTSRYPLQEGVWAPGELSTQQFGEEWQFLMDSDVPTCRSLDKPYAGADHDSFQYYVVDGFIVSSNIEVRSCKTQDLGFVCSDHNPVLLECILK